MFEIKRLDLNVTERNEFLQLMSTSFSRNSTEWLEWKYIKNPLINEKPTVFGTIHKNSGKLIGIRPFLACNIAFRNKTFKAAQPGDTVVHPDYRGKGLFTEMNKVAIEQLGKEGYDLFFNFPNRNSQPGNLKMGWRKVIVFDESFAFNNFNKVVEDRTSNFFYKLGGKIMSIGISNLSRVIKKLGKKVSLFDSKVEVSIEETFDDSVEELWLSKEQSRFRVKRDSNYLNWRFRMRPDKVYRFWTIREKNDLLAYMITTTSNRWGSKEGQIVDFNYIDEEYFFIILEAVLKDFNFNRCNFVSILACTERNIFEQLNNMGFIHRFQFPFSLAMPERNFLVRVINPALLHYDLYKGENWSLRSGDQDTY
jgi:GNAT superfamily N-acetyltransferase